MKKTDPDNIIGFEKKSHLVHKSPSGAKFEIDSYEYLNNPGGKHYYIQARAVYS